MNSYNLDKLIKIECNDFYPSVWYEYKKELKIFGMVIRRAGIYNTAFHEYFGDNVPEHHVLRNGVVYEVPEVVLHFYGEHSLTLCFDTFNAAKDYVRGIVTKGNWLNS